MTPPAEVSPLELVVRAPRILSLCAGIGGIELGIKLATDHAARVVCICEGEAYCAAVLRARMQDGYLDDCPIWSDLRTFDSSPWRGVVDCIIGGFPCQPFSVSGQRRGADDPRHLWPQIVRHIEAIRPAACFFENVTGLFTLGFEQVCQDLQRVGYHVEAGIFSAEECGASHQRQRLFFFAYADGMLLRDSKGAVGASRLPTESANHGIKGDVADAKYGGIPQRMPEQSRKNGRQQWTAGLGSDVADADGFRCIEGRSWPILHERRLRTDGSCSKQDIDASTCADSRSAFSGVDRAADGIPQGLDFNFWPHDWEDGTPRVAVGQEHRIDRLRALGNAVVPATAALAWRTLTVQAIRAACAPATE